MASGSALRVALEEVLRRFRDLRGAGSPERLRSSWANALTSLAIEFEPGERELG